VLKYSFLAVNCFSLPLAAARLWKEPFRRDRSAIQGDKGNFGAYVEINDLH